MSAINTSKPTGKPISFFHIKLHTLLHLSQLNGMIDGSVNIHNHGDASVDDEREEEEREETYSSSFLSRI